MQAKNTVFPITRTINCGGNLIDFSTPRVMGILNITPDSFYEGSRQQTEKAIIEKAAQFLSEGATFIDMGAYSSRPGAMNISAEEETTRLLPALKAVLKEFPDAIVSVDTFRASVAEEAIDQGAKIINDISGGNLDKNMFATVARLGVPYIMMHMKGTPQTMLNEAVYDDLMSELTDYFAKKIQELNELGHHDIIIDPGFGFAKNMEHNYELLSRLHEFQIIGAPILVGISRKSMIYKTLETTSDEALNGTTIANTIALIKGASILRVHDVKEALEAVKITSKLN